VYVLGEYGSCLTWGDRPDDPAHLTSSLGVEENAFLIPRDIPDDVTLVLTVGEMQAPGGGGGWWWWVATSAVRGDAPPCVQERPRPPTTPSMTAPAAEG
jgi:hypothetical protein